MNNFFPVLLLIVLFISMISCKRMNENIELKLQIENLIETSSRKAVNFNVNAELKLGNFTNFSWNRVLFFEDSDNQDIILNELKSIGIENYASLNFISYPIGGNRTIVFFIQDSTVVNWVQILERSLIDFYCENTTASYNNYTRYSSYSKDEANFYVFFDCDKRYNVIPSSCFNKDKEYWLDKYTCLNDR